jgi:hypothetical protein
MLPAGDGLMSTAANHATGGRPSRSPPPTSEWLVVGPGPAPESSFSRRPRELPRRPDQRPEQLPPAKHDGKVASERQSDRASKQSMTEPTEQVTAMQALFRAHYLRLARFREDGRLADELASEAQPVLEALHTAFAPADGPRALHEPYALLNLLARRAATLGATPCVALALPTAIALALRAADVRVDSALEHELAIVSLEGYSAARDERVTGELRQAIAERQVAVRLGPRCIAIFLAGVHDEPELTPTLDRFARELLRGDVQSCLLDISRLHPMDEDLARALGRFCGQAGTLGVCTFLVGASAALRDQFDRWSVVTVASNSSSASIPVASIGGAPAGAGTTTFVDDYELAQTRALAAAGLALRARRNWTRLFFPTRGAMVR